MANLKQHPIIDVEIQLTLNSKEAAALNELSAWGADKAVDALAKALGTGMLEEHREGLQSLLESSSRVLPGVLGRVKDCRKVFTGEKIAVDPDN